MTTLRQLIIGALFALGLIAAIRLAPPELKLRLASAQMTPVPQIQISETARNGVRPGPVE